MWRRLTSPLAIVLADQALISGMRLLTQVLIARFALESSAGIGFYVATFGFVIMAVMLAESFVTTPVNVFLPHQPGNQRGGYFGDSFRFLMRLIGMITAICCLALLVGVWLKVDLLWRVSGVLLWYLPLHLVREYGRRWLLVTEKNRLLLAYDFVTSILLVLGLVICIAGEGLNAIWAFGLITLANLGFVCLWWFSFRREVCLEEDHGSKFDQLAWSYGRWVAAEGFFSVVLIYFTQWQITATLGAEAADRYGSCLTLVFIANPFLLGVVSYFGPLAAKLYAAQGAAGIRKASYQLAAFVSSVLLVASMVVWFGGDWLMLTVFGERFADLGGTVTLLSLGMLMMGSGFVFATSLQALQAPQINFWASLASGLVVVSLSMLWLRREIEDAAWAFLISAGVGMTLRLVGFHLKLRAVNHHFPDVSS